MVHLKANHSKSIIPLSNNFQGKNNMENFKNIVVSLSGGMDSSTLLLRSLKEVKNRGGKLVALSFFYGQKHRLELEKARELVEYLRSFGYEFEYEVIRLEGLSSLLDSALTNSDWKVPEGHYAETTMRETVVPNRNKIFASITQAVALSLANKTKENTAIALGIHAGDHAVYPDCRQEFRDADDHAFKIGNWDSERVVYFTPYLYGDKFTILQEGQELCEDLGLNFDEVYKRTNTSYNPIEVNGKWYSDYKSSSSIERLESFIALGRPDPVQYADETGLVDYVVAETHAKQVLESYNNEQKN